MYDLSSWLFNHGFKFQDFVCNGCHGLAILCLNVSNITVRNVDYRCIIHNITINLLKNSVLKGSLFIKNAYKKTSVLKIDSTTIILTVWPNQKNLETKNVLIHEKNYKDLTIYFTR